MMIHAVPHWNRRGFTQKDVGNWEAYIFSAASIAYRAHDGQRRKHSGEPYFEHLHRVATTVARSTEYEHDPEVIAAAFLHDIIEDTSTLPIHLEGMGVTDRTIAIVIALTKPSSALNGRLTYIQDLEQTPEAWVIKRADMCDNLSTLPGDSGLWDRYPSQLATLRQFRPDEFPSPFTRPTPAMRF